MASIAGGGKTGSSGGGGNSAFDIAAIQQALGQNMQMLQNRYQQLGLGVPDPSVYGGDPLTAAMAGGSLQYGSPGTAEQTDMTGLQQMAQAALGQLQNQNINNPAIPGTPANQLQGIQNASQLGGQQSFSAGFNTPSVNTGGPAAP